MLENESYDDLVARHRFFEQAEADLAWAPSGGESPGGVGYHVRNASVTEVEVEPVPRVVAFDVVDHPT